MALSTSAPAVPSKKISTLIPFAAFGEKLAAAIDDKLAVDRVSRPDEPPPNPFDHSPSSLTSTTIIRPESSLEGSGHKTLDEIISKIAGQPVFEQQLRRVAERLGFDANAIPDKKSLEKLKRYIDSRLYTGLSDPRLPSSVSSTHREHALPPTQLDPFREMITKSSTQRAPNSTTRGLEPIRPVKNDNSKNAFEKAIRDQMERHGLSAAHSNELISKFANLIGLLPPNANSMLGDSKTSMPMTRDSLDFVFKNALNS